MPIKYPAVVTPECKWCGKVFELYAIDGNWRRNFQYCSPQCKDNCSKAWKRGGSQIEGPLIGKVVLDKPADPKRCGYNYYKVVPESFLKEQEEKQDAKKALSARDQEYWDALRRHKGIEVREADNSDGQ